MENFFGILAATFFGFFPAENPEIFSENKNPKINFSAEKNENDFLPRPENAIFTVEIFLDFKKFSVDFFENSAVPLKNKILEKKLPIAISFSFLSADEKNSEKIRDFLCVEQFSKKWESWLAVRAILNSENPKNEISEIAKNYDFPADDFEKCRASDDFSEKIAANIFRAEKLKISGIPAAAIGGKIFVGKTPPENLFFEIEKIFAVKTIF